MWESLYPSAKAEPAPTGDAAPPKAVPSALEKIAEKGRRQRAIQRRMAAGNVTKAAQELDRLPLAPADAATRAALEALHPDEAPPQPPEATDPAIFVSPEMLQRVLKRLPYDSAPGHSGFTYEHIAAALKDSPQAFTAAVGFLNAMLAGRLPHIPDLLDSAIVALKKPNAGVRPIAVGETWVRLASLCAMDECTDAGLALAPLQLGVGVPGGSQCVALALDAGMQADAGCVTLQIDFTNAFNTIGRAAMLRAVRDRCPAILPFVWWQYSHHTRLMKRGASSEGPHLMSKTGVRQGSPDSMLLFGLTLQFALEAALEASLGVRIVAYADDVYVQGTPEAVQTAFTTLRARALEVGLRVNLEKSNVYSSDAAVGADAAHLLGVRHAEDGIVAAGTPLGKPEFVAAHIAAAVQKAMKLAGRLKDTPVATQTRMLILRLSLLPRLAHLTRTVPWELLHEGLQSYEQAVENQVYSELKCSAAEVERVRKQVRLPLRFGGLGFRRTTERGAVAARLSALALTEKAMSTAPEQLRPFSGAAREQHRLDWQRVVDDAATTWTAEQRDLTAEIISTVLPSAQQRFNKFQAERDFRNLLASYDDSDAGKAARARLRSFACRQAVIWMDALPTTATLTISNNDYVSAAKHQLGLLQMPGRADDGERNTCPLCMHEDSTFDHALTCKAASGAVTWRHGQLLECWRRVTYRAGITTDKEPAMRRLRTDNPDTDERGDIEAIMPDKVVVGDVSVVHYSIENEVAAAAVTAGSPAKSRDQEKIRKYADMTLLAGTHFVPLSHESSGRLGKPAWQWLQDLAAEASSQADVCAGVTKASFISGALKELGVTMCKGNAKVFHKWKRIYASSGKQVRVGRLTPTDELT